MDSVRVDSTRLDCESEVLNLESKFCLDSKFALHSALGLLGHSKIFDEKCGLQEKVRGSYLKR
ncbi:hypothetical protein [uncultured Helicobacter sp.]|uniref:hypothetical protein n=1 Tax=uncultured Helicobacter sp. TaxID=175537 RepID=UPI003752F644